MLNTINFVLCRYTVQAYGFKLLSFKIFFKNPLGFYVWKGAFLEYLFINKNRGERASRCWTDYLEDISL